MACSVSSTERQHPWLTMSTQSLPERLLLTLHRSSLNRSEKKKGRRCVLILRSFRALANESGETPGGAHRGRVTVMALLYTTLLLLISLSLSLCLNVCVFFSLCMGMWPGHAKLMAPHLSPAFKPWIHHLVCCIQPCDSMHSCPSNFSHCQFDSRHSAFLISTSFSLLSGNSQLHTSAVLLPASAFVHTPGSLLGQWCTFTTVTSHSLLTPLPCTVNKRPHLNFVLLSESYLCSSGTNLDG